MLHWRFWAGRRDRLALALVGVFTLAIGLAVMSALTDSVRGTVTREYEQTWRSPYDILVHVPLPDGALLPDLQEPNLLSTLPRGITLAQWETVRQMPDVSVAAPIAAVGYLAAGPSFTMPSAEIPLTADGLYQAHETIRSADPGVPQVMEDSLRFARAVERQPDPAWPPLSFVIDGSQGTTRYVIADKATPGGPGLTTVAQIPVFLAGIDPEAESKLVGLDRSVTEGKYLSAGSVSWGSLRLGPEKDARVVKWPVVPVMINLEAFRTMEYTFVVEELNADQTVRRTVFEKHWTPTELAQAIGLGETRAGARGTHRFTGSSGPLRYSAVPSPFPDRWPTAVTAAPHSADLSNLFPPFTFQQSSIDLGPSYREWQPANMVITADGHVQNGEVSYDVVGYFNSANLDVVRDPKSNMPLMTYRPAEAEQVLDESGKPLNPPRTIAGGISPVSFLTSPPALLTNIQGAAAIAGDGVINAIQVKVAGTDHFTPDTIARVQAIARQIEQATGLAAEVTMGSSPASVLVQTPPSGGGPGFGWLEETWIHKNAGVTVLQQFEFGYSAFILMILVVGALYALATALAGVTARQRELGVAVAVGWPRGAIARVVMGEQLLFGLITGLLAAVVAAQQSVPLPKVGLLFGLGVAIYLPAMGWAGYAAARTGPGEAIRWGDTAAARRVLPGAGVLPLALSSLVGRPVRTLLTIVAIALPAALLLMLTFITQELHGALYTTLTGQYAALKAGPLQYAMNLIALTIAAVAAYDLLRQNSADHRREHALLSALGWPRRHIAMTIILEGLLAGLAAGVLGSVLGLGLLSVLYGRAVLNGWQPLLAAIALPAGVGLLTGALSALAESRMQVRAGLAGVSERQVARFGARTQAALSVLLLLAVGFGLKMLAPQVHWPGPASSDREGSVPTQAAAVSAIEAAIARQNQALAQMDLDGFLATLDPDATPFVMQQRHWLEALQLSGTGSLARKAGSIMLLGSNTARVTLTPTAGSQTESFDTIWIETAGGVWLEHGIDHQAAQVGAVSLWYPASLDGPLAEAVAGRARAAAALLPAWLGTPASPVVELTDRETTRRSEYREPVRIAAPEATLPALLQGLVRSQVMARSHNQAAGWLQDGMAQFALDQAGYGDRQGAVDLLRPFGPVPFERLAALPPGSGGDPQYERAVATTRLLAAYLAEEKGTGAIGDLLDALAKQPVDPRMLSAATYAARNQASLAALAAAGGQSLRDLEDGFTAWFTGQAAAPAAGAQAARPVDPTPGMNSHGRAAPAARTQYTLNIRLDPTNMQLTASQQVRFTNNEEQPLDSLYFHLFPNTPHLAQGDRPGVLTVTDLRVDGRPVPFSGDKREILGLRLPTPLPPGQSVTISLQWSATIPDVKDRYGVDGRTIYLGNFYPLLAVHDAGGYHLDRYVSGADPFYSDVADYDVTFAAPSGYQIAATGHAAGEGRFVAQNVRDFAAAAGPDWEHSEQTVDGVRVHSYYNPLLRGDLTAGETLATAAAALRFFSQQWGPYPYTDLTIVNSGGMEYPQFVMAQATPRVIAHEIAHQWWYGTVGNDENRQVWDEGLADFSALLFLASTGRDSAKPFGAGPGPLDDATYRYTQYVVTLYGRGWRLWEAVRSSMGDERFTQMVRSFYEAHQFGVATWSDWRTAVLETGGPAAVAIFDAYVYQAETPANLPGSVRAQE